MCLLGGSVVAYETDVSFSIGEGGTISGALGYWGWSFARDVPSIFGAVGASIYLGTDIRQLPDNLDEYILPPLQTVVESVINVFGS